MGIHEELSPDKCQTQERVRVKGHDKGVLVDTNSIRLPEVYWTLEEGDSESHRRKWWSIWLLGRSMCYTTVLCMYM